MNLQGSTDISGMSKIGKTENKSSKCIEYRNSKETSIWQLPLCQVFAQMSHSLKGYPDHFIQNC